MMNQPVLRLLFQGAYADLHEADNLTGGPRTHRFQHKRSIRPKPLRQHLLRCAASETMLVASASAGKPANCAEKENGAN